MNLLDTIPPQSFSLLAALIALLLSENLSADENNVLGNFIVSVGSIMLTIAAQQANLESQITTQAKSNMLERQIELLNMEVSLLKKDCENLLR